MKHMRIISVTLIIAMLLSMAGLAEAPAEMEQYVAEAADTELIEYAVPASEYLLSAGAPSVTLTGSKASAAMDVEESLQIAVNAGETGVFTSKNPKLASVDGDGLVTALAKGTAKIEFKPDGGKKRTLTIKISDPYEPTGVKFDQGKAATVDVGDDLQLDAVLAPETARTVLTWKSSKPKAADVDADGLVTALTEGKATITVTTANKKKATISVTVVDPYKPTGVSFGQGKEATLNVGDDLQLDAVLAPETARTVLTWKSNKPKAADVDADGRVTALTEGKATITVTTANKKKATISVTVVDPYKPTGVSLAQGKAATLDVGETLQLDAALAPESARTVLTWKSSKPRVAEVDENGLVTALARGTTRITATTHNGKTAGLDLQVVDDSFIPISATLLGASYNGVAYNVVNTPVDPITYADLVYDDVCTHPQGTDKYSGYCLCFCNYYVSGMIDGLTDIDVTVAKKKYRTSKQLSYKTEKYSDPNAMMARLYDLLNAGVPQILMVEAITHPGSRHFVTVVGYKSSVTRRDALRAEDLLVIDSFDGKLESMDPKIELVDTRTLFKQSGKYRIEAAQYK